jgi:phage recombination protein Bet
MDRDKVELIKQTVAKGASDLELELFMHACKRTGLDPLMKQIYAIKRWNNAEKKEVMAFQTGIDGYRLIADRTNRYAPGRAPEFKYNEHHDVISATAFVKKQTVDGEWHECSATAYWDEYVQTTKEGKPTSMWLKMPHLMLAKCAEALALRQAFPAELSGVYTHEEMMQADSEPRTPIIPASQYGLNPGKQLEAAPQLPTAEPTESVVEQPPLATDSKIVEVGFDKGKPLHSVSDKNLLWLEKLYAAKLQNDPGSSYRSEWEEWLLAIEEEKANREANVPL